MKLLKFIENHTSGITITAFFLFTFGIRLWLLDLYGTSLIKWDNWGLFGLFTHAHNGTLSIADIWHPVNEHRPIFAKLLYLWILEVNQLQWDIMLYMTGCAVFWSLIGVCLLLMLKNHTLDIKFKTLFACVLILWSLPYSWENVFFGAQLHFYMFILFNLLGIWAVSKASRGSVWAVGLGLLFLAVFTTGSGFLGAAAVLTLHVYRYFKEREDRRQILKTIVISALITAFGFWLYLMTDSRPNSLKASGLSDFLSTLGKSLSWPYQKQCWPFVVLHSPIAVLVYFLIKKREKLDSLSRFLITLWGLVMLIAISIAYARGGGGQGPSGRYGEMLVFGSVVNVMAFNVCWKRWISDHRLGRNIFVILTSAWLALFVWGSGLKWRDVTNYAQHMQRLENFQSVNVRKFLVSNNLDHLQKTPPMHIPLHNAERLARALTKLTELHMHPADYQVHSFDAPQGEAFVFNGTRSRYRHENVIGSYNLESGKAQNAMGSFESALIKPTHSFLQIPVTGWLAHKSQTLTLVETQSGHSRELVFEKHLEPFEWGLIETRTPDGPFRLVATDNSREVWFGFAMPRQVGRLSYYNHRLLDAHGIIICIGFTLLLVLFGPAILLDMKHLQDPRNEH